MQTDERYTHYDSENPPAPGTWLARLLNSIIQEKGASESVPIVVVIEDTDTGIAWAMTAGDHDTFTRMRATGASLDTVLPECAMSIEPELRPKSAG